MSKISRQMVPAKNDQNIRFSVSVGIAEYSNTIQTTEEFIGIADNALYAAKNSEEKRVFY
jgi:diguanylate cyclase (GGDEF)-like protein